MPEDAKKLVWDIPTRAFHWLLTCSLVGSWITAEAGFEWTNLHFLFGYFSLGLIAFRIIWGFRGTRHALFRNFVKPPSAVVASFKKLFSRTPSAEVGHNPIGGWSVLIMLTLVAIQAGSGLFISDDIFWAGPYNSVVSPDTAGMLANIHHTNFVVLQITVAIHIMAIAWYSLGKKANLIKPMITGKKFLSDTSQTITDSKLGMALAIVILVSLTVTALVLLAPPPPLDDYSF